MTRGETLTLACLLAGVFALGYVVLIPRPAPPPKLVHDVIVCGKQTRDLGWRLADKRPLVVVSVPASAGFGFMIDQATADATGALAPVTADATHAVAVPVGCRVVSAGSW